MMIVDRASRNRTREQKHSFISATPKKQFYYAPMLLLVGLIFRKSTGLYSLIHPMIQRSLLFLSNVNIVAI